MKLGGVGAAAVYDDRDGIVKLVVDAEYGEILGAHIVGNRACDMIAELVDDDGARGRLPGAGADHPPPPDDLRGDPRRRPRGRRLGDPRSRRAPARVSERATFYFDLGSPYAYLAAERISGALRPRPGSSSRSGSRSCSAGCSSASAATPGRNGPERERGDAPRSSAAPPAYGLPPLRLARPVARATR